VQTDDYNIPMESLTIYKILFSIEVGLREFIIEMLDIKCGPKWWKQRLPLDVQEAYQKGRTTERNIKWCQLIPHHPLYYIEFPDLKKVIERNDNWKDVFQPLLKKKEVIISTLTELEPIRNKIAHNRKATEGDLRIVEASYQKIVSGIGEKRFSEYVSRCTLAEDIPAHLLQLRQEATDALTCCRECKPLESLQIWENSQKSWWFDSGYLGWELSSIEAYFEIVLAYGRLPRKKGEGHKIEEWVKSSNLEVKYSKAMEEFEAIFKDEGV